MFIIALIFWSFVFLVIISCIIYITKNTPIKAKVDKYLERYVETQRNTPKPLNPNTPPDRSSFDLNTRQTPPPLNPNTLRNHSTEIQFQCDHCNSTVFVYKHLAGTQGKCPNCGHKIQIPH